MEGIHDRVVESFGWHGGYRGGRGGFSNKLRVHLDSSFLGVGRNVVRGCNSSFGVAGYWFHDGQQWMQFSGDNAKQKGKRSTVFNVKPKYNMDVP